MQTINAKRTEIRYKQIRFILLYFHKYVIDSVATVKRTIENVGIFESLFNVVEEVIA